MSLNRRERAQTSAQLRANLALSGLDTEDLAIALNRSPAVIEEALEVAPGADPALVWELRDHVQAAVRTRGARPVAFTVLTEDARSWFGIR